MVQGGMSSIAQVTLKAKASTRSCREACAGTNSCGVMRCLLLGETTGVLLVFWAIFSGDGSRAKNEPFISEPIWE